MRNLFLWDEKTEQKWNERWCNKHQELKTLIDKGLVTQGNIGIAFRLNSQYVKGALDALKIFPLPKEKGRNKSLYRISDLEKTEMFHGIQEKLEKLADSLLPKKEYFCGELYRIVYPDGAILNVKTVMDRRREIETKAKVERRQMEKFIDDAFEARKNGDDSVYDEIIENFRDGLREMIVKGLNDKE